MSKDKRTWWELSNKADYLIVGTYVVLFVLVLRKHEPWADEAQAWLIARDSGLFELLFQRLRYEGHPGLWYLILMIPSRIFPYYPTIQVMCFLIAVAGVYVFVRTSPFPIILKILFPFTYFIFYQIPHFFTFLYFRFALIYFALLCFTVWSCLYFSDFSQFSLFLYFLNLSSFLSKSLSQIVRFTNGL